MAANLGRLLALVAAVALSSSVAGAQAANQASGEPRRAAKPVVAEYAPNVPPVFLSAQHAGMCRVLVGDEFPAIELPQLNAGATKLSAFAGEKATIVLFWTPGQWMSRAALADIARIAASQRDSSVGVIGVVGSADAKATQEELSKADAKFSQLVDAESAGLARVGTEAMPRVYVVDGNHRIAWFDIEYTEGTRRELQQVLAALTTSK